MAGVEVKSVSSPDETRDFAGMGEGAIVTIGERPVLYGTFQPGWRWSECVKPVVGGDSCQVHHVGYVISGRMHVAMDDGQELELGPGEAMQIPPGHDAWIVGDETFKSIDFGAIAHFGVAMS